MCIHHDIVEKFVSQSGALHAIIAGLTDDELNAHPVPNTWSIRQIAIHLWDSDDAAGHRMKRTIAEELPLVISYDETAFNQKLGYEKLDVQRVAKLFELNRLHLGELLRPLPTAAFSRCLVHNQRGKITLGELVGLYASHVDHHMKFVREKRAMLGKPLPA